MSPEQGTDRNFQSQLLRRGARRPGASRISGEAKTAAKTGWQRNLGKSLRRHLQFRTIPHKKWRGRTKIFSPCFKKEQKQRFLDRIDDPLKNWKFSSNDANERDFWDDYMEAYEQMIQETATKDAPWYIVPADNKWFTRVVVAAAVIETLDDLDLGYPEVGEDKLKELAAAKKKLLSK